MTRTRPLFIQFVIGLLTLPAYLSGVAAEAAIKDLPGVSAPAMTAHHDAALPAFAFMMLIGAVAWLALWQGRRISHVPRAYVGTVLLLSIVILALMARAADIGGEVRHPEILAASAAAANATSPLGPAWFTSGAILTFVSDSNWVWPAAETLHFLGLCLLFGVILLVNLRILGVMKAVPFSALHRLLPWALLGFALNTVTGMVFFLGTPGLYIENISFYWKIALMLVAGASFLYATVAKTTWGLQAGDDAGPMDKAIAASALCLWAGVMYFGRMLPFIGSAF